MNRTVSARRSTQDGDHPRLHTASPASEGPRRRLGSPSRWDPALVDRGQDLTGEERRGWKLLEVGRGHGEFGKTVNSLVRVDEFNGPRQR